MTDPATVHTSEARGTSRCTISSHEEVMRSRLMRIAIRKWRLRHYIKWKFNWSQTIMRCARNHAGQEWHSLCVFAALTPSPPTSFLLAVARLFCNILPLSLPPLPPRCVPSFSSARARLRVERIKFHILPLPSRGPHSHDSQLLAFPAI